jgi:TonB family protein
VHHARYYLSKTLQSSFDESKVGKSLRGNYICVEDTANNGVNNYEIKGYTSDILTLKLVNEKNPTYTNTFFRITENPKEAKDKIETDKVYQVVEKMPEFPGGKQRLLNWMKENIQYPVEAQKEGIQGRVIITFVINKSGKAVEPLIIQSVDPLLDKEAIRLINSMPKWKPGEEKGEPVRVKFTMPINFRLSGGNLRR